MISHNNDKTRNEESVQYLNSLANSHSIKDQVLKNMSEKESLQNVSKVTSEKDNAEDNDDGSYKINNFL